MNTLTTHYLIQAVHYGRGLCRRTQKSSTADALSRMDDMLKGPFTATYCNVAGLRWAWTLATRQLQARLFGVTPEQRTSRHGFTKFRALCT